MSGLPTSSLIRQGLSSRAAQLRGMNPSDSPVEKKVIFVANGFTPPPIVKEAQEVAADYFRFGKLSQGSGSNFEIQPKAWNPLELDNDIASIRIFGKGTQGQTDKDLIAPYSKFIINGVQEAHIERSQIVETFGDFYVFFYGERPPVYNFTGTLINTRNANWVTDWNFMYDNFLRGTKCVEQKARAIVTYGGRQIDGLMLDTSNTTVAATEGGVSFQFRMVVTSRKYLGFSEDFGFVATSGGLGEQEILGQEEKFAELVNTIAGVEGTGTSRTDLSSAFGDVNSTLQGGPAQGLSSITGSVFA